MSLKTQRRVALWLFVLAIAAVIYSTMHYHFGSNIGDMYAERYGDKLDRSLKKVAGADALNCGRITVPKGHRIESECAQNNDSQHHTFFATYATETADGVVYRGIARSADGKYAEFRWQPGEESRAIWGGPDPVAVPCTSSTLHTTWQGVVTCTDDR